MAAIIGGAIAGVASIGSSLIGGASARDSARRQAAHAKAQADRAFANQAGQTAYATEFQNQMIDSYNKRTTEEYDIRLDQYKEQLTLNNQAAIGAFNAEQVRLNEQFAKAAFNRTAMLKELYRAQGMARASGSGRASKSRARMQSLDTLAEFGRANMMLSRNLTSATRASNIRMQGIAGKHYQSDLAAWGKIAIAPRMMTPKTGAGPNLQSPIAAMSVPGMGFGDIAGAALGGVSAFASSFTGGGGKWNEIF